MSLVLDRLRLRAPAARAAPPSQLEFTPGTHALSVADPEVGRELARIVCGLEEPKRGRVLVEGREPLRTPALRARLGATFRMDFVPARQLSARQFWERARALRQERSSRSSSPLGLLPADRFETAVGLLSDLELRLLELELALGLERPEVVWLHQAPELERPDAFELVLGRLRQCADQGAVVVVTVRTRREAEIWGDQQHAWERPAAGAALTVQLVVERPREVAAELQADAAVVRTALDPERPGLLLVTGTDDLAVRKACARAVVARRCELREMVSLPGGLPAAEAMGAPGSARRGQP